MTRWGLPQGTLQNFPCIATDNFLAAPGTAAGTSPDIGKAMYATPADASMTMEFNQAKGYAQGLNTQKAYGHDDWRVPTSAELNVLFNNRAASGGFDMSGSYPAGWYWSATQYSRWYAFSQCFSLARP